MQHKQWLNGFTVRVGSKGQTVGCRNPARTDVMPEDIKYFFSRLSWLKDTIQFLSQHIQSGEELLLWWLQKSGPAGLSCCERLHDAASECVSCCEWGMRLASCVFKLFWLFCDCNFCKVRLRRQWHNNLFVQTPAVEISLTCWRWLAVWSTQQNVVADFSADDLKASGVSDEVLITFLITLGDHTEFLHVSQISWIWVYSEAPLFIASVWQLSIVQGEQRDCHLNVHKLHHQQSWVALSVITFF